MCIRDSPVTQAGEEGLTPQIVIDYINNHYARPIVATDVGQNQLWTTQFPVSYTHLGK